MLDAEYGVKYRANQGGVMFAWFITKADAEMFATLMERREDVAFDVVKL